MTNTADLRAATQLWSTVILRKESGSVEVGKGTDGRYWFSFTTDTEGNYGSMDISEAQLRGLLAFVEAESER